MLPQTDPLFTGLETLTSQVASTQETHIFSPNLLNTMTFGFTRAAFNYAPGTATQFPGQLIVRSGTSARRHHRFRLCHHDRDGSDRRRRSEQRFEFLESPESFYLRR